MNGPRTYLDFVADVDARRLVEAELKSIGFVKRGKDWVRQHDGYASVVRLIKRPGSIFASVGLYFGRKRVERLMRCAGLTGVHRRRLRGCTRRDEAAVPSEDLVGRRFTVDAPNRLWCADVTQHRTGEDWFYLAVVLDAFSRRVVGWAMADHMRTELVVDALQMAVWNRRPQPGTVHHSVHGSTYTSWAFGHRLREAGLLGSMGTVGDALDNSVAESFFATLQTELLDRSSWPTRADLGRAVFAFIEGFYNPRRRHSALGYLSPVDYETAAARHPTETAA